MIEGENDPLDSGAKYYPAFDYLSARPAPKSVDDRFFAQ
jgi:hypothetical protein